MCLTWHTPPSIWCMCAKPWGLMKNDLSWYGLAPGFCPRREQLSSLFCFSFPAFAKVLWRLFGANPILLAGEVSCWMGIWPWSGVFRPVRVCTEEWIHVNHITEQNADVLLSSFDWPHMIHETHDGAWDKSDEKRLRRFFIIIAWCWFNHFFCFCLLLVLAASVPMPSYPSSGSGSSSSSSSTSHLTSPPVSTARGMLYLC